MAQYKQAMARMFEGKGDLSFANAANEHHDIAPVDSTINQKRSASDLPSFFQLLRNNDHLILYVITPIIWCLACVLLLDRSAFINTLFMPFLGLFAAFLANSVPIGGGIVYIPAFALLGVEMKLGVAFTVATMTIGNGVFGLLRWLRKDETIFIWESFQYTVLPCGLGTLIAIFCLPAPSVSSVRLLFAGFTFLLGIFVLLAVYRGGVTKVLVLHPDTKASQELRAPVINSDVETSSSNVFIVDSLPPSSATATTVIPEAAPAHVVSFNGWLSVVVVSFLAGVILVPNIGIGPTLTTFLMLSLVGYKVERALVTGIITGGWVCILPFLIHIFYYDDVPYQLWVMVIPGIFFGAQYAPYVHEWLGMNNVLSAFALFLFATTVLFLSH